MPSIIWLGQVFYDGQSRNGRVVRINSATFCFEVDKGEDAMGKTNWATCDLPFHEFVCAAGNLIFSIKESEKLELKKHLGEI